MQYVLDAFLLLQVADLGTTVVDAVGDDGPAVVRARLDQVELIAAARAVLGLVERAGHRMEREALRAAVAVGVDLRCHTLLTYEWVVARHAAVIVQAEDIAGVVAVVLRIIAAAAVANA